jgi:sialic acid synthase SpsE
MSYIFILSPLDECSVEVLDKYEIDADKIASEYFKSHDLLIKITSVPTFTD